MRRAGVGPGGCPTDSALGSQPHVQARLLLEVGTAAWPTVQFFLVAFALYVGYTRVSDHKHTEDALAGLLQGALVASPNKSSQAPTLP